jgi:hypothetical protein
MKLTFIPSLHRGTKPDSFRGQSLGIFRWSLLLAVIGATTALGGVQVSPNIAYFYSDGPGEGLSVSADGKFLMISSPIELDDGNFMSFVPHLNHRPELTHPFVLTHDVALGFGEVTDVAVLPGGPFGLAVVRGDDIAPLNALLAIRGNQVLQTIPIPDRPDGMKVTPNGRFAVVAVEKGGEIRIYDLQGGAGQIRLAALVTESALAAYYEGADNPVDELEPEAVGIAKDSSFALVTIQDSSSVAAVDLTEVLAGLQLGLSPEAIGDLALKNVVHLPYGYVGSDGELYGVEPDGVDISPDQSFAMLAHETNQRSKHLSGFSVLDLRGGLEKITARSYCVFDVDPSLLANTGLNTCPMVEPGDPYPVEADNLPRLDPASFKIVNRGGETVAALVIERYAASDAQKEASKDNESQGSVLFMDVAGALDQTFCLKERVPVGVSGSHLEVIASADHDRWIFVSISNGGGEKGTIARLELIAD